MKLENKVERKCDELTPVSRFSFIHVSTNSDLKVVFLEICVSITPKEEQWQRSNGGEKADLITNTGNVTEEVMKWKKEEDAVTGTMLAGMKGINQPNLFTTLALGPSTNTSVCFSLFAVLPPLENTEP